MPIGPHSVSHTPATRPGVVLFAFLFSLLLLGAPAARAGGKVAAAGGKPSSAAQKWLKRMGKAVSHQNYVGDVVYGSGSHLSMAHVVHRFHDGRVQERLISLNGAEREIYRDGARVVSIMPRRHLAVVAERAGPLALRAAHHGLGHDLTPFYALSLPGEGRVAGHRCQRLRARARDRYRYSYRFCLDDKTALPLRIQILSDQGQVLEQMAFSHIAFPGTIPDRELALNLRGLHVRHMRAKRSSGDGGGAPRWRLSGLPPGFHVVARDWRWLPGVARPVAHILCSDGLAVVSVFISPLHDGVPPLRGALGAFNAYATVAGVDRVTVMGEVPQATLRFIGRRVEPVAAPQTDNAHGGAARQTGPSH